jgi:hypothetical protein
MTSVKSSPTMHHLQFSTANIYKCLAPCKECTGNYISELLQKRFICRCPCHLITSWQANQIERRKEGTTWA